MKSARPAAARVSISTASGCASSTGATSSGIPHVPRPGGMLRRLHERGPEDLRVDQPLHRPALALFEEAPAKGLPHEKGRRRVWQTDLWQPGMGIVDFTNPGRAPVVCRASPAVARDGRRLLQDRLRRAHSDGRGLSRRLRSGEDAQPLPDPLQRDGLPPAGEVRGQGEAWSSRARPTPRASVSRCTGAATAMVDVRVDGGEPARRALARPVRLRFLEPRHRRLRGPGAGPAVYKRWVAFGLLSSHSRLHGSSSYRVPWNYDDEACDVLRFFTKLKCRLMPYLYGAGGGGAPRGRADDARDAARVSRRPGERHARPPVHARRRAAGGAGFQRGRRGRTTICRRAGGRICSPARCRRAGAGTAPSTISSACRCLCVRRRETRCGLGLLT
jgi:hypothetical protein